MGSYEINVLSVERSQESFDAMNSYELMNILPKIAKSCKINVETMNSFYDMYYEYTSPPDINYMIENIIDYILKDKKFIPRIFIDLQASGKNPWNFYMTKTAPQGSIRTFLTSYKKVYLEVQGNKVNLMIPRGQEIDILDINGIKMKNIKSIYLTTRFYNLQKEFKSSYKYFYIPKKYEEERILIPIELDVKDTEFMNSINEFYNIFPNKFYSYLQFLTILLENNLYNHYINSFIENNQQYILDIKTKKKILFDKVENRNKIALEVIKDNLMKDLIRKYYPKIYLKYFKIIDIINHKTILNSMGNNENIFINDKYKLLLEYKNAYHLNRCPHVSLVRNFRNTSNINKKLIFFNELKNEYIKDIENEKTMYTCRKCNFNMICPHVIIMWKMLLENASMYEIREKLDSFKLRGTEDDKHQNFCKICREVLFDANFEEIQGETYKIIYKDIYNYLWADILLIFPTLRFNTRVNIYNFSSTIVFALLSVITKSKIPDIVNEINIYFSTEKISNNLKFYLLLYVYGYILNLIRVNKSDNNSIKINLEEKVKGNNVSNYAEVILKRFSILHRSIFNIITIQDIETIFTNIYTELAKSDLDFVLKSVNNQLMIIFNEVLINTTFNYSFNIAIITNYINIDEVDNINFIDYELIIEKVLGTKIKAIANGTEVNNYTKVYQPDYLIPVVENYLKMIKKDKIDLYDISENLKGRRIYSFKVYMSRYLNVIKDKYNLNEDSDLVLISKGETKIKKAYDILYKIPTNILNCMKEWKYKKLSRDNNITAIYSEEGIIYNWDIIVYKNGKELNINEDNSFINSEIVDYRDSKIGILKNNTYKNNTEKTISSYKKRSEKQNFFNFFKVRCPEESIHTFEKKKCTKCGIIENSFSEEYYSKYYDIFKKEVKLINTTDYTTPSYKIKKVNSTWTYNDKAILEVVSISSYNKNVIESIGAMENRTFLEIVNGRNRPPLPKSLYDPQLSLVISHYYWLIRHYNRLIFGTLDNEDLLIFFKKEKIDIRNISNEKTKLDPNLFEKNNIEVNTVLLDSSVPFKNKYRCVLENICKLIILISKINKFFYDISRGFIRYIIRLEILTSLSDNMFDKSVFKKVNSIKLDIEENDDFDIDDVDDSKIDSIGDLSYEDVDIIYNT